MNVFVPEYDWNCQWSSPEEAVKAGQTGGEYPEGYEFTMVQLSVGAQATYKVVDGRPVIVKLEFPQASL